MLGIGSHAWQHGTPEGALNHVVGIAYKTAAALIFTGLAALAKYLSETFPVGELVFARSFFALPVILGWVIVRREFPTALRTARHAGHLWRATIGVVAMSSYYVALSVMPLPDVTAITYASPFLTLIFATVLLGERVGVFRWSAVAVGMVGIMLILWPHLGAASIEGSDAAVGVAGALSTAVFMALVMIQLRSLAATETTGAMVFYFFVYGSLFALATAPFGWVMPTPGQALLLLLLGLVSGVGQILMVLAYRHAPASVVAPFEYTTMIWALILGWVFFGDLPEALVFIGAGVVIAAGLFVIYRESRLGLRGQRRDRVDPPS